MRLSDVALAFEWIHVLPHYSPYYSSEPWIATESSRTARTELLLFLLAVRVRVSGDVRCEMALLGELLLLLVLRRRCC